MKEKVERQESIVVDSVMDAMLRLMQEKHADAISVKELAELAGIGRVTFYRNFLDKDDVLRRYLQKETVRFLKRTDLSVLRASSMESYAAALLQHMLDYREVVDLLYQSNKLFLLEAEFDRAFQHRLHDTMDKYQIAFLSGGFYKVFCRWAEDGYRETPEQIASVQWIL